MGIAQVLVWVAASCGFAEAAPDPTVSDRVDFYLSAMLAGREKLRSGEFVVSGTKSARFPAKPQFDYAGKVLISCALDENRIRLDNLELGTIADFPLTIPRKTTSGRIERKFFRTPEQSVTWLENESTNRISIGASSAAMLGRLLFFDVRALGLTTWQQVTDPDGSTIEATADGLKRLPREKSVDTSEPEYVQLVFVEESGPRSIELRYWLRPDQGFTPVRQETRTRRLDPPDGPWQVGEHAEISWEQTDGVWVPTRFEMTRTQEGVVQALAWKVHWRSVNKPIDDALFDWRDFGAPDTVEIINVTRGTPVVVRQSPKN